MKNEINSSIRIGGLLFMISGLFFAGAFVLLSYIPQVPSTGPEIIAWLGKWRVFIALSNELTFFAAVLMVPGIYSIFSLFFQRHKVKTILGCSLISMSSMTLILLVIVQGRLCYPVFGMQIPQSMTGFVLSIYWGGMHTVFLLLAGAVILTGFSFPKDISGKFYLTLSLVVALAIAVGAYPWLIGRLIALLTQLAFSLWFIVTGMRVAFANKDTSASD